MPPCFRVAPPMPRLLLLLLPLALVANLAGGQTLQEKRFGPPAPGDTLPKVVSREFELSGPTVGDVRKANGEIRLAISQFGNYLGEHPKKMAFVLFRSAAEAGRYDTKPLTRHGLEIVPWILPPNPPAGTAQSGGDSGPSLEHEAGHVFLVAYVEHALAEAGKTGSGGAQAPGTTGADAGGRAPDAAPGLAAPVLHPDIAALPDWLEEAIATLCERPSVQIQRIEFMRAHLDQRIPFAELLEMRRPAGRNEGKGGKAGGGKPAPKAGATGS